MAQQRSFSQGMDTVLYALRQCGASNVTTFPTGLQVDDVKRRGQSLHRWFKKIVDDRCMGDASRLAMEDTIAILAILRWKKKLIIGASVTILVVSGCTLAEYYACGTVSEEIYLRLDLSYDPLGGMFSHPLAHIHIGDGSTPRFALEGGNNGNVVVDFLEFIYRNFAYREWREWARRQWTREYPERAGEFDQVIRDFTGSNLTALRSKSEILSKIKGTLRESKDRSFDFRAAPADIELIEYPAAR
jgi:hypothetical protein